MNKSLHFTSIFLCAMFILLLSINHVNAQVKNVNVAVQDIIGYETEPTNLQETYIPNLGKITTKQRLDSIFYEFYDSDKSRYVSNGKAMFTYDAIGRKLSEIRQSWNDSFNKWQNSTKTLSAYDENGYKTLNEGYQNWNQSTNKWIYAYKTEYIFDKNGNKTFETYFEWDSITQSFGVGQRSKIINELNNLNKPIIYYHYINNGLDTAFELVGKNEYKYDSAGNVILSTYFIKSSIGWDAAFNTANKYNNWGKIETIVSSNFTNNKWQEDQKSEFIYDLNGNKIREVSYSWNSLTNEWDGNKKSIYAYDNNNFENLIQTFNWDTTTKSWINNTKVEKINDSLGNVILSAYSSWFNAINQWNIWTKTEYQYNYNYADSNVIYELNNFSFKHMLTNGAVKSFREGNWLDFQKFTLFYSPTQFNNITEHAFTLFNIYPNPSSGKIIISNTQNITTLGVYSSTGKLVYNLENNIKFDNLELDLSNINNGIYFIHFLTESGQFSSNKIIIAK